MHLGTQNCSTWVPLLKLLVNKINEHNHKRALGAKEGVPNEDTTWEYEYFAAYKYEIAWGQAILGGEDCNVPNLNNCIAGQFHLS